MLWPRSLNSRWHTEVKLLGLDFLTEVTRICVQREMTSVFRYRGVQVVTCGFQNLGRAIRDNNGITEHSEANDLDDGKFLLVGTQPSINAETTLLVLILLSPPRREYGLSMSIAREREISRKIFPIQGDNCKVQFRCHVRQDTILTFW